MPLKKKKSQCKVSRTGKRKKLFDGSVHVPVGTRYEKGETILVRTRCSEQIGKSFEFFHYKKMFFYPIIYNNNHHCALCLSYSLPTRELRMAQSVCCYLSFECRNGSFSFVTLHIFRLHHHYLPHIQQMVPTDLSVVSMFYLSASHTTFFGSRCEVSKRPPTSSYSLCVGGRLTNSCTVVRRIYYSSARLKLFT
jgi:hypothetical protein